MSVHCGYIQGSLFSWAGSKANEELWVTSGRFCSDVIKGSRGGLFWERKIKPVRLSHLPQSQTHLMWSRLGAAFLSSPTQMKWPYWNLFWWEWLSLVDKLKDCPGTPQTAFKVASCWELGDTGDCVSRLWLKICKHIKHSRLWGFFFLYHTNNS